MTITTDDLSALTSLPVALASRDYRLVAACLRSMQRCGTVPDGVVQFYAGRVSKASLQTALDNASAEEPLDSPELLAWQAAHPHKHYSPLFVPTLRGWLE